MNDEEKKKQRALQKEKYVLRAKEQRISDAFAVATQKIAQLQEEISALKSENAMLKEKCDYANTLRDERFIEEYALRDETLKNRIIEDYLRALTSRRNVSVLRGGMGSTPLTPPKKPRSLAEAKKMAEILIKG